MGSILTLPIVLSVNNYIDTEIINKYTNNIEGQSDIRVVPISDSEKTSCQ